jgi:peptidyl-dipeptidase Dcp
MKHILLLGCVALAILLTGSKQSANPFFKEFDTPFGVPPFDEIQLGHYQEAFEMGMKEQNGEIDAIVTNGHRPTFENTIEALERSGAMLGRVSNVFFALNSSLTSDEMQEIAKDIAPKLSAHDDEIMLNEKLFAKVKAVYDQRKYLDLAPEQNRLLEETYKEFVRGGALLAKDKKARFKKINERLSVLSLQFGENVLKENNKFELVITDEADLAGLPDKAIASAAEAAKERGHEGKWVFTLHKPSMIPFLQYSDQRDLRKKIYMAYINRGNNNDELDNKKIVAEMAALRAERAKLLGYETHADYVLDDAMAKKPANVYKLLDELWTPALKRAKAELAEMQAIIDAEGGGFDLQSWDWWYYAEKLKKQKYDLEEEMLRPYFKLENVRAGAFEVAHRLYGLQFVERPDLPKYHEDVETFEVKDADGSHLAILYVDYFPRASKRGGAWMSEFLQQSRVGDRNIRPVVFNVGNFSKPTADEPALLSFDEVTTLFHEFGHGLHGMLSQCTYESLAGTNVCRDFVELQSQIMENWASDPTVLKMYARHYQTGEPMPDELIEKIRKARHFNQGFATTEYLAASYLDMDWHTLSQTEPKTDVLAYEDDCLGKIGLIPEIISRYRSPYFRHVFAGGYSSGYYSYVWAEVLDADAFQAFKETGDVFDQKTAASFRKNILERGNTEDPMKLYVQFRGREPSIEPLLERRGLN